MTEYTRDEVSTAVNGAADMLNGADLDSDTVSLVDFMVNAALTLLDNPDADVDDVLEENWGDGDDADAIRSMFA